MTLSYPVNPQSSCTFSGSRGRILGRDWGESFPPCFSQPTLLTPRAESREREVESLERVRNILVDFEQLSGLSCNVEKTTLMQFGSNEPVSENITRIGFDIKTELTLLGL
jgi:hypothetical protein